MLVSDELYLIPFCHLLQVLILVLVDVGLGRPVWLRPELVPLVLILVLVDVGLGPTAPGTTRRWSRRLNPCFSGCWSRTELKLSTLNLFSVS